MESVLAGEGHSELGDASMEAVVTSVQLGVPLDADVERPRERRGEGEAERDAAAPERHAVAEVGVRRVALRRRADVHHLPPVVLPEHGHQVVRGHHGVVVHEHHPPRAPAAAAHEPHGLGGDARDPEARGVARGVRVPEPRRVLRHPDRREEGPLPGRARPRRRGRPGVEPHVPAHGSRVPPHPDVLPAARPEVRGARDPEHDVAERQRGLRALPAASASSARHRKRLRVRRIRQPRGWAPRVGRRGQHEEDPQRRGEEHGEERQDRGRERAVPRRERERERRRRRRLRGVVGLAHWARERTTPPPVATDIEGGWRGRGDVLGMGGAETRTGGWSHSPAVVIPTSHIRIFIFFF